MEKKTWNTPKLEKLSVTSTLGGTLSKYIESDFNRGNTPDQQS